MRRFNTAARFTSTKNPMPKLDNVIPKRGALISLVLLCLDLRLCGEMRDAMGEDRRRSQTGDYGDQYRCDCFFHLLRATQKPPRVSRKENARRSHDAVIRVYDEGGNVIQTHFSNRIDARRTPPLCLSDACSCSCSCSNDCSTSYRSLIARPPIQSYLSHSG
jgi:hypothetical protein